MSTTISNEVCKRLEGMLPLVDQLAEIFDEIMDDKYQKEKHAVIIQELKETALFFKKEETEEVALLGVQLLKLSKALTEYKPGRKRNKQKIRILKEWPKIAASINKVSELMVKGEVN